METTRSWPSDPRPTAAPRFGRTAWFGVGLLTLGAMTVVAGVLASVHRTQQTVEGPGAAMPVDLREAWHPAKTALLYGIALAALGLGLLVPSLLRGPEQETAADVWSDET